MIINSIKLYYYRFKMMRLNSRLDSYLLSIEFNMVEYDKLDIEYRHEILGKILELRGLDTLNLRTYTEECSRQWCYVH